jgi:hypothetical protein
MHIPHYKLVRVTHVLLECNAMAHHTAKHLGSPESHQEEKYKGTALLPEDCRLVGVNQQCCNYL